MEVILHSFTDAEASKYNGRRAVTTDTSLQEATSLAGIDQTTWVGVRLEDGEEFSVERKYLREVDERDS